MPKFLFIYLFFVTPLNFNVSSTIFFSYIGLFIHFLLFHTEQLNEEMEEKVHNSSFQQEQ